MVKQRCQEYLEENKFESLAQNTKDKIEAQKNLAKNEIKILEKKIISLNDKIYDDKVSGLITENDFERIYAKNIELRNSLEIQIEELQKESEGKKKVDSKI